jgi:methyl-accepting chemotaxis protein
MKGRITAMIAAPTATAVPRRHFWQGMRVRIAAQILLAALLPVLVITGIALAALQSTLDQIDIHIDEARQITEQAVGNDLSDRALMVAGQVDTFMLERIQRVILWAREPSIAQAARRGAEAALELGLVGADIATVEQQMAGHYSLGTNTSVTRFLESQAANTEFPEVFLTEAHGYIVSASGQTSDFVQSDEAWWVNAWQDGLNISPPEYDESVGAYSISISVRVSELATGERLGVLKAVLNISRLQALIDQQAALLQGGEALIFLLESGPRLADTSIDHDPALILTDAGRLPEDYTPVRLAAELQPDAAGHTMLLEGRSVLGTGPESASLVGYARTDGEGLYAGIDRDFAGFGWGVAISQPQEIALLPVSGLDEVKEQIRSQQVTAVGLFVVVALATIVGGLGLTVWQTGLIVRPVAQLRQVAQRLSAGNLSARIHMISRDELGDLSRAFNSMAEDLQRMVETERSSKIHLQETVSAYQAFVEKVAQGDLTARLALNGSGPQEGGDELTQLGHNLNQMAEALADMTRQVREAAASISAAAAEILAATTQQIASATEQDAAITQTMTTVEEVRATVTQTAERVQSVADASRQSVAVSRAGQDAVTDTIEGMRLVRQRTESIAENILMLSERAQQIGEITATVNDIADQSRLLALNASIEAARAGEEGKGFAVVAMEVRQLADQSREATARVRDILAEVQQAINTAVMVTEEGSKGVESGMSLAQRAGQAIAELAATIEEAAQASTQIAASTRQQTNGMDQLAAAMASIKQASTQTAASTRQAERSAQDLNDMARRMQAVVARYQI